MPSDLLVGQFRELDNSREEVMTPEGPEITIRIRCRWVDRYAIINSYVPYGQPFPAPERQHLTCQHISIKGIIPQGSPAHAGYTWNPTARYEEANIEARYRLAIYDTTPGATETPRQSWDIGAEVLELGISRQWVTAGTEVDVPVNVMLPYTTYEWEDTFESANILQQLRGLIGKVNSTTWRTEPAERLLYLGARVTQVFDENGEERFHVVSRIAGRTRSWNQFWRTKRQRRYPPGHDREGQLQFDANGDPIYVTGAAGQNGWDTLNPPAYESADFAAVLGS